MCIPKARFSEGFVDEAISEFNPVLRTVLATRHSLVTE